MGNKRKRHQNTTQIHIYTCGSPACLLNYYISINWHKRLYEIINKYFPLLISFWCFRHFSSHTTHILDFISDSQHTLCAIVYSHPSVCFLRRFYTLSMILKHHSDELKWMLTTALMFNTEKKTSEWCMGLKIIEIKVSIPYTKGFSLQVTSYMYNIKPRNFFWGFGFFSHHSSI